MPLYTFTDIFFVVAAFGFIVLMAFAIWGCLLIVGILRDVRHLARRAKQEGDYIVDDVDDLRSKIKHESGHLLYFFRSLGMILSRGAKGTRKRK